MSYSMSCVLLLLLSPFTLFSKKHYKSLFAGSPVLGYLAAGVLIGPYGLSIIHHVHGTKAIAEFGVVFLLFNIGLEVVFPNLNTFLIPS